MRKLITIAGALVAAIALVVASNASFWWAYQPKLPKCYRAKK